MKPVYLGLMASLLLSPFSLPAKEVQPACYQKIARTFFRDDITAQALALHSINQNLWLFIIRDLQRASAGTNTLIQKQAALMNPNPLQAPFNPQKASEMLENALYQTFYQVVNSYKYRISSSNINEDSIQRSFRYIWLQQAGTLSDCLGE